MEQLKDIIINTKDNIEQVTEMFYQGKNQEGFLKLIDVIDSLTCIVNEIEELDKEHKLNNETIVLTSLLNEATEALINKDTVLLADILKYDIADVIDSILYLISEGWFLYVLWIELAKVTSIQGNIV